MARRVNPMLAKLEDRHKREMAYQKSFTIQQCCDMMLIAAHVAFGFGSDRLARLKEAYDSAFNEYADMAISDSADDPSIEYTKSKLDRKLKQILGDRFVPWEERYEF